MARKPIPPAAWVLSGATGVAVTVLAIVLLASHGEHRFFDSGDPRMFLLTARDLFGTGRGFAALGRSTEIPYRYGRVGLPLVAWLLALGRPGAVGWALIGVNLVALSAIPGLAAVLLDGYGAPAEGAAFILVLPAFIVLYGNVVSDPLLIALLLLAFVLDARRHRGPALIALAAAVLVKEVAILALMPLLWRALRREHWRDAALVASTVLPYAAWCVWLRWRVGAFPFLARTQARRGALGPPFAGLWHAMGQHSGDGRTLVVIVAATIMLGGVGAWLARDTLIGALAAVYTLMTVCLGTEALRFFGEALRVLLVPQVFAILALVVGLHAWAEHRARTPARRSGRGTDPM